MIIIINPYAGGGRAGKKWKKIGPEIVRRFAAAHICYLQENMSMKACLADALRQGHQEFIAAGGDGTVNLLLQNIIELVPASQLDKIKLGAIGLGSSNDFHKPFSTRHMINGIPCKFNFSSAEARDVGTLTCIDHRGQPQHKYWLLNASIGITAEANLFFNTPDFILNYLKKSITAWAILYAALYTIARYRNRNLMIKIGKNRSERIYLTNMGIVKSPHFSGNLSYNTPFEPANGQFYINICREMNLLNTLNILRNLSRNRFLGLPNTESRCSDLLSVQADQPLAIEFDGEVVSAKKAAFTVKQKMIRVCTC